MFSMSISIGRAFHLRIGQMDYGRLYGIYAAIGRRSWSWTRPEPRVKAVPRV